MNSKHELIISFLDDKKPCSEVDEKKIVQFCLEQFGLMFTFDEERGRREVVQITYDEFKQQVRSIPRVGSVIVTDNKSISIVKSITSFNNYVVAATLMPNGTLEIGDRELDVPFRIATEGETIMLQEAFHANNISWINKGKRIGERFIPKQNTYVRISILGKKIGLGIFRELDKDGISHFYCLKLNDAPIKHSLNEILGYFKDYQFDRTNNEEKKFLDERLKVEAYKKWNAYVPRFEPIDYRIDPGGTYFFIDETFTPQHALEKRREIDRSRFHAGNYYLDYQKCVEACNTLRECSINMLNEHNGSIKPKR